MATRGVVKRKPAAVTATPTDGSTASVSNDTEDSPKRLRGAKADDEARADVPMENVAEDVGELQEALRAALDPIRHGLTADREAQISSLHEVASDLMCRWDLWIGEHCHRILELEAYVHSPMHADPYTHGDEGQRSCGVWYFHRQGTTFKSGSFKGLDLACGDSATRTSAGLLIRSVIEEQASGTPELTEGPCLVVDRILRLCGQPSIQAFVAGRTAAELPASTTGGLCLRPSAVPRADRVWTAPRVGLVLRSEQEAKTHSTGRPVDFVVRPYRFSTAPWLLRKFRAGFVATDHVLDPVNAADRLPLLKLPNGREYRESVEVGRAAGNPERFVDKKIATQTELCELVGASTAV
jgi:hypothetical protein